MKAIEMVKSVKNEKGTELNMVVVVKKGIENIESSINADGHNVVSNQKKVIDETEITITANDKGFTGFFTVGCFMSKKLGVYAMFDNKIGLSKTVYDQLKLTIDQATAEAESSDEWMALQAKRSDLNNLDLAQKKISKILW